MSHNDVVAHGYDPGDDPDLIQPDGPDLTQSEGYLKLKAAVEHDCERNENCFNPEGCDKGGPTKCYHRFCDKFKWVLERVKHYSEHTGIPVEQILTWWEDRRDYWYMNYYQEANQPVFGENLIFFKEWEHRGTELFGEEKLDWLFRCLACGHVQSPRDFKELGKDPNSAYQCCIGRYDGKGKRALGDDLEPGDTCDYTLGGLISLAKVMVVGDDLVPRRVFDFADTSCPSCRTDIQLSHITQMKDLVYSSDGRPAGGYSEKVARLVCTNESCDWTREPTEEEIQKYERMAVEAMKKKKMEQAQSDLLRAVDNYIKVKHEAEALNPNHQVVDIDDTTIIMLKHPEKRYRDGTNDVVTELVEKWDDREEFVEFMDDMGIDWDPDTWHDHIYIDCNICHEGHGRRDDEKPSCSYCGNDLDEDGNPTDPEHPVEA